MRPVLEFCHGWTAGDGLRGRCLHRAFLPPPPWSLDPACHHVSQASYVLFPGRREHRSTHRRLRPSGCRGTQDAMTSPDSTDAVGRALAMLMPLPLPFLIGIVGAVLLVALIISSNRRMTPQKDPQRMFSAAQRLEGFSRAGSQCELESVWFKRCTRRASHGDHHYPHSKGGATSMMNFTAACVRCNTSKGAKVPTSLATWRLERRRRGYFPAGVPVAAGQRI